MRIKYKQIHPLVFKSKMCQGNDRKSRLQLRHAIDRIYPSKHLLIQIDLTSVQRCTMITYIGDFTVYFPFIKSRVDRELQRGDDYICWTRRSNSFATTKLYIKMPFAKSFNSKCNDFHWWKYIKMPYAIWWPFCSGLTFKYTFLHTYH